MPRILSFLMALLSVGSLLAGEPIMTAPAEKPEQLPGPVARPRLKDASGLVRAPEARQAFGLSGRGFAVAILDTGIRATHADFAGRVLAQRNYTSDNNGDIFDATDGNGHGTNVSGIIAANGDHVGIAPGAGIVALKVLDNSGRGMFSTINNALTWVLYHRAEYNITVINMSLSDGMNYQEPFPALLQDNIRALRAAGVAVVVAAGNKYSEFGRQGMAYPAIFPECVSVGATYDADVGKMSYSGGAIAFSTGPKRLTPFSQRLAWSAATGVGTDLFAPGADLTSSGILNDHGESTMRGTSQASPVVAGAILLAQEEYAGKHDGALPTIDMIEAFLRGGATQVIDGDDEDDNVPHSGGTFGMLDVMGMAFLAAGGSPVIMSPITAGPAPILAGMPVRLGSVAMSAGTSLAYSWDFGDGTTGSGQEARHAYAAAGSYEVKLLVTDSVGQATDSATITVLPADGKLTIEKLTASVRFGPGRGRLRVTGKLPAGLTTALRAVVGVGTKRFELSMNGWIGKAPGIRLMVRDGRFSLVATGDWVAGAIGMADTDSSDAPIGASLLVAVDGKYWVGQSVLSYTARHGRSGRAVLRK